MWPRCSIFIFKTLVFCSFKYEELVSDWESDLTDRNECDKVIFNAISNLCSIVIDNRISNPECYLKKGFLVFSSYIGTFQDQNLNFQPIFDTHYKNNPIYIFNLTIDVNITNDLIINILSKQYVKCGNEILRFESRKHNIRKKCFRSIEYQTIYKKKSALYRFESIKSTKDLFEFVEKKRKNTFFSKNRNKKNIYFLFTEFLKSYERLILYFCFDFYKILESWGDTVMFFCVENSIPLVQNVRSTFQTKNNEPPLISAVGYFLQPHLDLNDVSQENIHNSENKSFILDLVETNFIKSYRTSKIFLEYGSLNLQQYFATLNPQKFNEWILPDFRIESSLTFYPQKNNQKEKLIKEIFIKMIIPNFKNYQVLIIFALNSRNQLVNFSYKKYFFYKLVEEKKYLNMESLQPIFDTIIEGIN